jgi:LPPG:FO 2-phospho-L-lactate transferase
MSVALITGGIGGAKLALGLAQIVPGDKLTAIVNTGDDFTHLGLAISPDIDTLTYTLAGLSDEEKGWGRRGETWNFMAALEAIGGETWFALGDGDLALHVERTRRIAAGETLSAVTADFAQRLGVSAAIVPMSDRPVTTRVATDEGEMDFQRYFVERHCAPRLLSLRFDGAASAHPAPAALAALADPALEAILIAPSNPWLSVDPLLAVPGMREAIRAAGVPVVAVTPVPGGRAVKGPTAKIMAELGLAVSAASIAAHYEGVIDGLLLDEADRGTVLPIAQDFTDTIMRDLNDRIRVARAALALAERIR